MTFTKLRMLIVLLTALWGLCLSSAGRAAELKRDDYWNVDDIKPGMTGYGVTVLKGTQLERFKVDIIGVMKNSNPGQDIILARVGGIGLENTGVISGMSGSPVYIEEKLLGAIAYTWSFGKEPIGGITPFVQMVDYSNPVKRQLQWMANSGSYNVHGPVPVLTAQPGMQTVAAGSGLDDFQATATSGAGMGLTRIQTPVSASGFSPAALAELSRHFAPLGMFPVQGGAAPQKVMLEAADTKIEPGGAMAVGLVTGDLSMTAIGTVTSVNGGRVFGFGHPFFGMGECELPLLTAYIHAVIPRLTVSSKLGSPLQTAGRVEADVSTCVAGVLGKSADMMPMSIRVKSNSSALDRTFNCQVVRERTMIGPLAMSALGSCASLEGQAPVELTAKFVTKLEIEGYPPLAYEDTYSGTDYTGTRGIMMVYSPVANVLSILANNPFHRPKIKSVSCSTELTDRRVSAKIVNAEVRRPILEAGETLAVQVNLQPYQSAADAKKVSSEEHVPVELSLKLPADLKPGKYTATVGDAMSDFRVELRNRKYLNSPNNFDQLYKYLGLQLSLRRNNLVLRFTTPDAGVAIDGTELPNLPAGFADIFAHDKTEPITALQSSLVARKEVAWVVEGSETVQFEVVKTKDFYQE